MHSEVDSSGLHSERGCKNEPAIKVKPFLRIIYLPDRQIFDIKPKGIKRFETRPES